MNKKTLISLIVTAVVLLGGIAAGVVFLYKGQEGPAVSQESAYRYPLLQAIPSDAAAVLCLDQMRSGSALMTDGTKLFSSLVYDSKSDSYGRFFKALNAGIEEGTLSAMRQMPMAISLHYSGSIVPLVALGLPKAATDSTDYVAAARTLALDSGLSCIYSDALEEPVLLLSTSDTFVRSSLRHQGEGQSILSNKDFLSSLSVAQSKDVLFVSNVYASKLFPAFFQRPVSRHSDFFKTVASWTVMSLGTCSEQDFDAQVAFWASRPEDFFASVLTSQRGEVPQFASVVPSGTSFAVSLPMADHQSYLGSYRKYLDACARLTSRESAAAALRKSVGVDPDDWVKSLDIKEMARAQWVREGASFEALFVRMGSKSRSLIYRGAPVQEPSTCQEYAFGGFAASLFGQLFSVEGENHFAVVGDWVVSGSEAAVTDLIERYSAGDCLASLLSDAQVGTQQTLSKGCAMAAFCSAGAVSQETVFAPSLRTAVSATMDGAAFEPLILTIGAGSGRLEVTRVPFITKSSTPAVVSDAVVEIPAGPFEVINSGTGGKNLLAQQANNYLSLKEMDGKGVWSVPFDAPLCGAVESIDYYANGKIQWLFAAGSSLHLLDRLGRFVNGFPVDLGKEVLLGPAVFDFTGAKGYTAMVLHKDNTIGMYNLHGVKPDQWLGIAPDEKVIALPELLKLGGKSYWAVRTASQTMIYPFYGGDPVYAQQGAKSIRRDSELDVSDGSLKAVCNDGKTRNIKL